MPDTVLSASVVICDVICSSQPAYQKGWQDEDTEVQRRQVTAGSTDQRGRLLNKPVTALQR
jgi:hypothetical protein